ncbi:MAG: hypothetical protein CM15mV2_1040 [uncultured marine virus]|nr:MAG: hypothetical protein CM15mV2_1040 [uncultured marine virus]
MFNHVPAVLPPLERETVDGVRYYKVPDADEFVKLVSITSVTSFGIERSLQSGGKRLVRIKQMRLPERQHLVELILTL